MTTESKETRDPLVARRQFLAKCGKFAIVTPPILSVLLTATHGNYAVASSGRGDSNRGGRDNDDNRGGKDKNDNDKKGNNRHDNDRRDNDRGRGRGH